MVYGNYLDRISCNMQAGMEDDGTVLSLDVSYLWLCGMYWPCFQRIKESTGVF